MHNISCNSILLYTLILLTPNHQLTASEEEGLYSPLRNRTIGESVELEPVVEWKRTGAILGKSEITDSMETKLYLEVHEDSDESRSLSLSETAFKARYKVISGHAKINTQRVGRNQHHTFQIIMWANETTNTLRFIPSIDAPPRPEIGLSDYFKDKKYSVIRKMFGTHFISGITYGRRVMVVIDVLVKDSYNYKAIKADLGIAANASFWSSSIDHTFEKEIAKYNNLCDFNLRAFFEGGGGISDITELLNCDYRNPWKIKVRLQTIFSELHDKSPAIIDIETKQLATFDFGFGDWLSQPWREMRLNQSNRRLEIASAQFTKIQKLIDCGYEPKSGSSQLYDSLDEYYDYISLLLMYMMNTRMATKDPGRFNETLSEWPWKDAFCPHCGEPSQEPTIKCYCWSRSDKVVILDENSDPIILKEGVNEYKSLVVNEGGKIVLPPTTADGSSIPVIAVRGDFIMNGMIIGRRGLHNGCNYSRNWVYGQTGTNVIRDTFKFTIVQNRGGFGGPGSTPNHHESKHGKPCRGNGGGGGSDYSNDPKPAVETRGGHGAQYENGNQYAGKGGEVVLVQDAKNFNGKHGTNGQSGDALGGGGGARGGHGQCLIIICRRFFGSGVIDVRGWNGGNGGSGSKYLQDGSTGGGGGGGAGGDGGMVWIRYFKSNRFNGSIMIVGGAGGGGGSSPRLHGKGNGSNGENGNRGSIEALQFCAWNKN